jgi:hypothetical protein
LHCKTRILIAASAVAKASTVAKALVDELADKKERERAQERHGGRAGSKEIEPRMPRMARIKTFPSVKSVKFAVRIFSKMHDFELLRHKARSRRPTRGWRMEVGKDVMGLIVIRRRAKAMEVFFQCLNLVEST